MIYWREECKRLADSRSLVVVVDRYDENGVPVFAIRRVRMAMGSRNGKNSYWSVTLIEALSDECNLVTFPYVLAYMDRSSDRGDVVVSERLDRYHPAWTLAPDLEQELKWRKQSALHALMGGNWE